MGHSRNSKMNAVKATKQCRQHPSRWKRLSLALTFLTVCGANTVDAQVIHHFTFDAQTVADSVGTATGTLFNGASLLGGNLSLDGIDDYVQLNQKIVPTGPAALSVTIHAQQASVQSGTFVELISQGFSTGPGFYIGHDPRRIIRLGDQFQFTGVPFPSDGDFHFYALTSDTATGTRFYIDSSLVFSSPTQLNTTPMGTDTRFGRQLAPANEFFQGLINDVRVYDVVLTATEVAAVHADVAGVPFAAFIPKVGMLLGPAVNDDKFDARGTFTLGAASNGIDPLNEHVTLQVGTFFAVIPAGSFQVSENGTLEFEGVIAGVRLKVRITSRGGGNFDFRLLGGICG